jgi:DNA-binding GntR family transcriptional regulator
MAPRLRNAIRLHALAPDGATSRVQSNHMLHSDHDGMPEESMSAQGLAYQFVRQKVISGAYSAGDRLQPEVIAEELGISRMPVREALRQLDAEGLVTMRPNRGAIVTILTPHEVKELFDIRGVLEGLAARGAAQKATDEGIEELRLLNLRLQRVSLDSRTWLQHHHEFHDFLCEISGQHRLRKEIRRIRAAVEPYLLVYMSAYRQIEMAGAEHGALVDAIASRNGLLAEHTFAHHVEVAGAGVIKFLEARRLGTVQTSRSLDAPP